MPLILLSPSIVFNDIDVQYSKNGQREENNFDP